MKILSDEECINLAWVMALSAHNGQNYGNEPYITHVTAVFERVNSLTADVNFLIASILHDTVEDGGLSIEQIHRIFGISVAGAIKAITRLKSETYKEYIERVKENEIARLVKKCDLLENLHNCRMTAEKESLISRYENALLKLSE